MMGVWRLALRNLVRNAWRNVATGSAIAFGFAGLILVGGYILRVDDYLSVASIYLGHAGHVSVYADGGLEQSSVKPNRYSLSAQAQATIVGLLKDDARVDRVGRYLNGIGLAGNGCKTLPFMARGIEPETDRWVRQHPHVLTAIPELTRPRKGLALGDAVGEQRPISVSTGLARLLGKPHVKAELPPARPGPLLIECEKAAASGQIAANAGVQLVGVAFDGSFSAVDADMVGIHTTGMAQTEDGSVIAPLRALQELYDTDKATYLAVYLKDASEARAYARELETKLRKSGLSVSTFPYDDERVSPLYVGTHSFLTVMGSLMGTIVFLVIVLSIVNATTMTVLERTREIGTFRAIGFTRGNMLGLFLRESVILTAIGVLAGLVFSLSACAAVNAANIRFTPPGIVGDMQLKLEPNAVLCAACAVVMTVLCAASTLLAVWGRIRMKIADLNTAVSG